MINFKDNQEPDITANNLNLMQQQLENLINSKTNIVQQEVIISDYIDQDSVDLNYVVRSGHVVRVDFRGKVKTDIPNNTKFLTLPWKPVNSMTIMFGIGSHYAIDTVRWAYIPISDGGIRDGFIETDKYIHIMFTYTTND